jgi:RND family efflux transporter MFP subunit
VKLYRLLLAFALLACKHEEKDAAPDPVPVRVQPISRGEVRSTVEVAGVLQALPGLDVKLGPLVAGRLAQVLVGEGDRTREGQLLARLDATPLRDAVLAAEAQLGQAKAQEANARARLARAERALAAGVAAAQEVDDARLAFASAQAMVRSAAAQLSTARNQLGRSELRAPFAGVVAHVFAAPGEPLDANKPVVEVARTDTLELRAPLAPRMAARVRPGQTAELRMDGLPGRAFAGRVVAVAPTIDPATGAALVRVQVPNADGALRLGAFARARLILEARANSLRVPREALLPGAADGGASIEIVEDNKSRREQVELAGEDDRYAEIASGAQEGQLVIVEGNYALPDGTPVRAEEPAPPREGVLQPDGGPR